MYSALIAAIANGVGLIVDKFALSRERIGLNVYLPISFIFLFSFSLILTPFLGGVDWELALLSPTLFLFFLMTIIAIAWNTLYYQSVKAEKAHQHELIAMLSPMVTIILAAIFFPNEFDWRIFILALVASAALIVAKMEKAHLTIDQDSMNLFIAIVLMSAESIIIRELLYSFTPVALYAIRTFILAAFFVAYYSPRFKQVSSRHWWVIAGSSVLGTLTMVGRFYAFDEIGVIHATLITALAPLIVFFASWEFLHEKIKARVVLASLVILITVSIATILGM